MGSISQGSTVEPGQGAQPSPPCWQQPAHVPALGGGQELWVSFPHPTELSKLGGSHLVISATNLSSALGPQSGLCQQ